MGKGNFRPPTESTPLNRSPKKLSQVQFFTFITYNWWGGELAAPCPRSPPPPRTLSLRASLLRASSLLTTFRRPCVCSHRFVHDQCFSFEAVNRLPSGSASCLVEFRSTELGSLYHFCSNADIGLNNRNVGQGLAGLVPTLHAAIHHAVYRASLT